MQTLKEVIAYDIGLGEALLDLVENMVDGYLSLLPMDGIVLVSRIASFRTAGDITLSDNTDVKHMIEVIYGLSANGRSEPGEPSNLASRQMNTWFDSLEDSKSANSSFTA